MARRPFLPPTLRGCDLTWDPTDPFYARNCWFIQALEKYRHILLLEAGRQNYHTMVVVGQYKMPLRVLKALKGFKHISQAKEFLTHGWDVTIRRKHQVRVRRHRDHNELRGSGAYSDHTTWTVFVTQKLAKVAPRYAEIHLESWVEKKQKVARCRVVLLRDGAVKVIGPFTGRLLGRTPQTPDDVRNLISVLGVPTAQVTRAWPSPETWAALDKPPAGK